MPKILIIEDEENLLQSLAERLRLHGYETVTAADGEEGVMQALKHCPDLILCDILLPKLDGYGVLSVLRQMQRTAQIPVIFLTAKTDPRDVRMGMNLGADDYLCKPVSRTDLLQAIEARLKRHQAQEELMSKRFMMVQQLMNSFAHDLRAPLHAILTGADLLKPRRGKNRVSTREQAEIIKDIESVVLRLNKLTERFLLYSKVRLGKHPFQLKTFDLVAICKESILECAQPKRVQLNANPASISIEADEYQVREIMDNLISNALKYSPKDKLVHVNVNADAQFAVIEVRDEGRGIPAEDHEMIFEPFHRGSNTRGIPGSGFGLAITKSFVENHNGQIIFSSNPNNGTVFIVRLPRSPVKIPEATSQESETPKNTDIGIKER